MTPKRTLTFPKAAAAAAEPAGFARSERNLWIRRVGDFQDEIDLQVSSGLDEITVNLFMLDSRVQQLLLELAGGPEFPLLPVNIRLPRLVLGFDRWWKRSDPEGPEQLAAMIREHALPFFDRIHTPEGLLAYLEPTIVKWRNPTGRLYAALLLNDMGRQEECCALLADPPRAVRGRLIDELRRHLGCEAP